MKPRIFVIGGPTASGKSALALELAERLNGELVCADSLTVYRGLDIGSAKPSEADRQRVPHHLLDILNPDQPFTAADFRAAAATVIEEILRRGRRPIVVGGTGLYLRVLLGGLTTAPGEDPQVRERLRLRAATEGGAALQEELRRVDPESAARCHPNNLVRILRALEVWQTTGQPLSALQQQHGFAEQPYDALFIWLDLERQELYRRIEQRVDTMLAHGLMDEVRQLLAAGIKPSVKPLQAIGYKEVLLYLDGQIDQTALAELIKRNTRRLAKRQQTWFKGESNALAVAYPKNSASIESIAATFFREGVKPDVQDPLQYPGSIPEPVPQGTGQSNRPDDVRRGT